MTKTLPFRLSSLVSLGMELELQLVDKKTYGLISRAKDLIRDFKKSNYQTRIKPEITQSMLELNTSIHSNTKTMLDELVELKSFLEKKADKFDIYLCGGGTHPFQKWKMQKIFPIKRYKQLARQYRYLSKRSTVFGQHVHVGCESGDDALYLTHVLTRYVPQFIAISASSPFYQGIDTGYCSTRTTIFNAFPSSGNMPFLTSWEDFSTYFFKLKSLKIIESMKDLYWDIRPKPEFGTVEIRVCDTPLTIKKAILIAAYIQSLSLYLLQERPHKICQDLYYLYNYNRFQASRYGFDGHFINPFTSERCLIYEDILTTIKKIEHYANQLNNMGYIAQLLNSVIEKMNDATLLKTIYKEVGSLPKVVAEQCKIWNQYE